MSWDALILYSQQGTLCHSQQMLHDRVKSPFQRKLGKGPAGDLVRLLLPFASSNQAGPEGMGQEGPAISLSLICLVEQLSQNEAASQMLETFLGSKQTSGFYYAPVKPLQSGLLLRDSFGQPSPLRWLRTEVSSTLESTSLKSPSSIVKVTHPSTLEKPSISTGAFGGHRLHRHLVVAGICN